MSGAEPAQMTLAPPAAEEATEPSFERLRAYALKKARKKHPHLQVLEAIHHGEQAIFHIKRCRERTQTAGFLAHTLDLCTDDAVLHFDPAQEQRWVIDDRVQNDPHIPRQDVSGYVLLGLFA